MHCLGRGPAMAASRTKRRIQRAMHVNDRFCSAAFMQIVDILGHDHHLAGILRLQPCQRGMRSIRLGAPAILAPRIVKRVHHCGVAGETFGGGDLAQIIFCPQPVNIAKRAQPAFGRNPRAGEDDDPFAHFRASRSMFLTSS